MAEQFATASGHNVEVIPVTEKDLGKRATAAFAAGDLPDVIYHTLQYALPWAEAGFWTRRPPPMSSKRSAARHSPQVL